ncbi:hypothetical protein UlMin_018326 [Ulmus minor]
MSHFWKLGIEKPRLLEDEEGGVLFIAIWVFEYREIEAEAEASYIQVSYSHSLFAKGGRVIASTQPRRLASISSRVAEEKGVKLGEEFLTNGVLLREMMEDTLLTKYKINRVNHNKLVSKLYVNFWLRRGVLVTNYTSL